MTPVGAVFTLVAGIIFPLAGLVLALVTIGRDDNR
jgi:hypothetical protein